MFYTGMTKKDIEDCKLIHSIEDNTVYFRVIHHRISAIMSHFNNQEWTNNCPLSDFSYTISDTQHSGNDAKQVWTISLNSKNYANPDISSLIISISSSVNFKLNDLHSRTRIWFEESEGTSGLIAPENKKYCALNNFMLHVSLII